LEHIYETLVGRPRKLRSETQGFTIGELHVSLIQWECLKYTFTLYIIFLIISLYIHRSLQQVIFWQVTRNTITHPPRRSSCSHIRVHTYRNHTNF